MRSGSATILPIVERSRSRSCPSFDAAKFQEQYATAGSTSTARASRPDRRHALAGFRLVDVARKVVGVGSVGTRCWIALMLGRDGGDPLFLQVKEAEASVLEPYLGQSAHTAHGERVVNGQRMMQAASDIFLGWATAKGMDGVDRAFYLRQLWDGKMSADLTIIEAPLLAIYGQICSWTLARAHARSGDRIAISAYLGIGRRVRPRHHRVRLRLRRAEHARLRRGHGGERVTVGWPSPRRDAGRS